MTTLLAVDIGNSAVKIGRFHGDRLESVERRSVREGQRVDPLPGGDAVVDGAAIVSVVPGLTDAVREHVRRHSRTAPLVLTPDGPMPFRMAYETPGTLGTDRLAAAAGAVEWAAAHRPDAGVVLAVDAGTAVNIEVVVITPSGPVYTGGVIAPGPELVRRALRQGTAQLPEVPLEWPDHVVGRSTRSAIQAGLLPALVHAVDGLLQDVVHELGTSGAVVATGGWGGLLSERLPRIDHADPNLVLRGIRVMAALHRRV